jgi:hypothetical protein
LVLRRFVVEPGKTIELGAIVFDRPADPPKPPEPKPPEPPRPPRDKAAPPATPRTAQANVGRDHSAAAVVYHRGRAGCRQRAA